MADQTGDPVGERDLFVSVDEIEERLTEPLVDESIAVRVHPLDQSMGLPEREHRRRVLDEPGQVSGADSSPSTAAAVNVLRRFAGSEPTANSELSVTIEATSGGTNGCVVGSSGSRRSASIDSSRTKSVLPPRVGDPVAGTASPHTSHHERVEVVSIVWSFHAGSARSTSSAERVRRSVWMR